MELPDVSFEDTYWRAGQLVAGADEVGKGAFAGPVVAGAVVFAPLSCSGAALFLSRRLRVNDSKKLTALERERAAAWIKAHALSWSTGAASVTEINRWGITRATHAAFRRAIVRLTKNAPVRALLIDAFRVPFVRGIRREKQQAIIRGDAQSFSIAAASIIAKVHRDRLMVELGERKRYTPYCWDANKGYGTSLHRQAILTHGTTEYHRTAYVQTYLEKLQSAC